MSKKTKGHSAKLILLIKVNIIRKNKALICMVFDVGGLLINAIGGGWWFGPGVSVGSVMYWG